MVEPLFGEPDAPKMAAPGKARVFIPARPKSRERCAQCIRIIHRLGQGEAPAPAPVRWLHRYGLLTEALCQAHKQQLEME